MKLGLEGKKAVVTGGSKGIGLETVRLLAAEGADVLVCSRRRDALEEAAADVKKTTGRDVMIHPMDVTSLDSINELPAIIKEKLGRVDLLVNNAGTGTYKPFLDVTDEELQYGMAINFFAQFRICQRLIPLMIAQGGGRIVNVTGESGIHVFNPPFQSSCTGPAKAAENRLAKILANEFGPQNIRVNAVVPGFIDTPERFAKWEAEVATREGGQDRMRDERERWAMAQGMRNTRWGNPDELANLIVFALSDAASYINGAVLVADNALDKS